MSKRVSSAWQSFVKIENKKVKCTICGSELSYNGNTTPMLSHIRSKHPATVVLNMEPSSSHSITTLENRSAAQKGEQQRVSSFFTIKRNCDPKRAEMTTDLLTKMVATDLLPTTVVEGSGFRDLMAFIEPEYNVPSHQTIMRRIKKMHGDIKSSIADELNNIPYLAITTDAWTSLATDSYLTVTGHWIDNNWKMQATVLDTSEMDERHTAHNIAVRLTNVQEDWNLAQRIVACVRDNASNQVAAGNLLDEWPDIACSAHALQLAINAGFEITSVKSVIKASNRLVAHFKRSTVASTALEIAQKRLNLPTHKLIQSVSTRWNSVYDMLSRVAEQRQTISTVLADRKLTKIAIEESLALTPQQWHLISSLLPTLKSLQMATTVLSYECNVSLSSILPIVSGLRSKHLRISIDDNPTLIDFKQTVAAQLQRRFFEHLEGDSFIMLASVLDPRHKGLKFASDLLRQRSYEAVNAAMASVVRETLEEDHPPEKRFKDSAMAFLLADDYFDEACPSQDEFGHYLKEPPLTPNDDPLVWWKMNSSRFSNLSNLAKKYLCCPATSVPAERVFSTAGNIVNKRRSSLLPENVNSLVFLNKNLKRF